MCEQEKWCVYCIFLCVSHTFREKACAKWILTLPLWSPFSSETTNLRADIRLVWRSHKLIKNKMKCSQILSKHPNTREQMKWLRSNSRKLFSSSQRSNGEDPLVQKLVSVIAVITGIYKRWMHTIIWIPRLFPFTKCQMSFNSKHQHLHFKSDQIQISPKNK